MAMKAAVAILSLAAILAATASQESEDLARAVADHDHHPGLGHPEEPDHDHRHGDADDHHETPDSPCHHHDTHTCCTQAPTLAISSVALELEPLTPSEFRMPPLRIAHLPSAREFFHVPLA